MVISFVVNDFRALFKLVNSFSFFYDILQFYILRKEKFIVFKKIFLEPTNLHGDT